MRLFSNRVAGLLAGAVMLTLAGASQAKSAKPVPPPLPEEEIRVEKLSPPDGYRLYISDPAFAHMVDGRLHIVDGKSMKFMGMIGTGFSAQTVPSPDGKTIYVATTYQRHLVRAPREDVLEIHDAATLELKDEIPLPPHHAQAIPYRGMMATSTDGSQLYIQGASPATSVMIVDLERKKLLNEVATPGCWAIYPWAGGSAASHRISTLCGDGTMLTLEVDEAGQVKSRNRSARFFNPDKDPLFTHSDFRGDDRYFVSFGGDVYTVKLAGDAPSFAPVWSLLDKGDRKQGWGPGGYEMTAVHRASGTLFVALHPKSYDGSHKNPAKEIWAYDLETHKRIARIPSSGTVAISVSQGADARLYTLNIEKRSIEARAIKHGYPSLGVVDQVGDTPMIFEVK
ncbi:MAG TPA: amine dehydrogenase large subunit [Rhodocyclaceae bacterium]|nr:amine dehydrogenase large subunit [Rhodocyclaceae bacterium]